MITHTATPSGYDLKVNGRLYGTAMKEFDGSFSITGGMAFEDTNSLNHKTMAALKAHLEPLVPAEIARPTPRPDRLTYHHAKGSLGGHSRTKRGIEEAQKMWPEHARDLQWIYAWIIRRGHELQARFEWGHHSRAWLQANPTVGAYDHDEYVRRIESAYGPQPDWTW